MKLNATILPSAWSTRILVTDQGQDLLKARLPSHPLQPRALATLLEGVALWTGTPVHAVLVAAGPLGSMRAGALYEGLVPEGSSNLSFDIIDPRRRRRIAGPGDFRQVHLLHGKLW